jgi:beta-lactamase class A
VLDAALRDLGEPAPGLRLGCSVIGDGGEEAVAGSADAPLYTASVGKVLLLLTVAGLLAARELDGSEILTRRDDDAVGDSGVWQHLEQPGLAIRDLAWLVAAVSDNLATNVLLRRVGLEAVDRTRVELGLARTRLSDRVREVRGAVDPESPSSGSARELCGLFERLRTGRDVPDPTAAAEVVRWLGEGCDLSMVGSALMLDPLAHAQPDRGFRLVNKTGADAGVRADAGFVEGPDGSASYAVIANWDPAEDRREPAIEWMRKLGGKLRESIAPGPASSV